MGGFIILRLHGQVEFALSQIVLLGMISQCCQLQAERRLSVSQEHNDKAAVLRFLAPDLLQSQSLLIKADGSVQIRNIEIKMVKCQHKITSFSV